MIPKGNQRGGGQGLATHLLNAYDNDRVEVADVRGALAQDLHGAFAEWYAESKGTRCTKYLYSLSINPDHTQGPFTREHYYDFIRRTEDRLGLKNQPRAVVFHIKHGREHCHTVWSRIDSEKLRAVPLSHDHQKLRAVAQEYARDHNIILPPGMRNDRGNDRFPDHEKTENLGEKQQEERTGISKKQRMEEIAKAWRESSDARSFIKALADSGYVLARGDRRSYVVVDLYGEIHSLSRQLSRFVKSKDLKARLAGCDIDKLPAATAAQDRAREQRQALLLEKLKQERERTLGTRENAKQRRDALQQAQALRRADLETKRKQLAERHTGERKALSDMQSARSADIARARAGNQPKGLLAVLSRITGFNAVTAFRQKWQDQKREQEYRLQNAALARRHEREMENFKHRERGLDALDNRERRSLETGLRREVFRAIAAPAKTRTPAPELTPALRARADKAAQLAEAFRTAASTHRPGLEPVELTPEQLAKIAEFRRTAKEIAAPGQEQQRVQQRGQDTVRPATKGEEKIPAQSEPASAAAGLTKKPPDHIAPAFNEAAGSSGAPSRDSLSAKFNDKAATPAAAKPVPVSERGSEQTGEKKQAPPRETQAAKSASDTRASEPKKEPKDLTPAQRRALDLAKEFNERAGQTGPEKERDQEGHERDGREKHYRRPPQDFSIRR